MISLHRSWALLLVGPTDNIIRQRYSSLHPKMNIVSPLPFSEAMRQARGEKSAVCFHIQGAETRQPVPAPSIKGSMCAPWFPRPLCSSPQFLSPTSGLVPLLSVLSYDTLHHHVLQSHSHSPRHRRTLGQRFGCSHSLGTRRGEGVDRKTSFRLQHLFPTRPYT